MKSRYDKINCASCGNEFLPTQPWQLFCCTNCEQSMITHLPYEKRVDARAIHNKATFAAGHAKGVVQRLTDEVATLQAKLDAAIVRHREAEATAVAIAKKISATAHAASKQSLFRVKRNQATTTV